MITDHATGESTSVYGKYFEIARRAAPSSTWDIIKWWECRRGLFNLIVGFAGLLTILMYGIALVTCFYIVGASIPVPDPPLFADIAIILYGFLANVFYTAGWMAEILFTEIRGRSIRAFGPIAFSIGSALSAILTLLPGLAFLLTVQQELARILK